MQALSPSLTIARKRGGPLWLHKPVSQRIGEPSECAGVQCIGRQHADESDHVPRPQRTGALEDAKLSTRAEQTPRELPRIDI